jgi:hypothetical protein
MKANTIEGRTGTTITVAGALALGANTITTTGAGTFGTMNATNLGRSINAAGFDITGAGTLSAAAVTGTTGTFTTLNATNLGGSVNAAGYNITGAGTVSGVTGNFTNLNASSKVTASNVTTSTLTLGGRTGTSASPYDVYVGNATNAAYATNAGTATTANNSLRLGGKTLQEVIDSLPASGPSGIPTATAINNRTAGNTTLAVTKGKWYKIQMRSGSGAVGYNSGGGGETSDGTEPVWSKSASGGTGVQTIFYVRATDTTTWNINYYIPTGTIPRTSGRGGTAVEIAQGTTIIAILGGGGGGSADGKYSSSTGGAAGVPGTSGGAAAGSASGGSKYPTTGGAAVLGTKTGVERGGSGYSAGARGGGGGSSYINMGYGNLVFEQFPAAAGGTPLVSIWVYN